MFYANAHQHQKEHNRIVRDALKRIAKEGGKPYQEVERDFRNGGESVTLTFWKIVREACGDEFGGVAFCDTCRKFELYPAGEEPELDLVELRRLWDAYNDPGHQFWALPEVLGSIQKEYGPGLWIDHVNDVMAAMELHDAGMFPDEWLSEGENSSV